MQLFGRRWPLYLGVTFAVASLQAALYFTVHIHRIGLLSLILLGPIIVTVVYVYAHDDATGYGASASQLWGRILERLWAVILIDFAVTGLTFVFGLGLATAFTPAGGAADLFVGAFGLFALGLIVFADVHASVSESASTLMLLPDAFATSAGLAVRNVSRVLFILALSIFISTGSSFAYGALHGHHVRNDAFWADLIFEIVFAAPMAAIVTAFYLECLARRPEASS